METLTAKHFRFGEFELDGTRRLLLRDGEPVSLNPKAFDLLLTLVESRGDVLSKDELLDRVWPGQFVEEGNLKVHISALRKAFGETRKDHRFIVTVPGRGYSFVTDLEEAANGDIVIEQHSLSRIVVEQEIREDSERGEEKKQGELTLASPFRFSFLSPTRALTILSILLLTLIAVWIYNFRDQGDHGSLIKASAPQPVSRVFATGGGGIPERVAISRDGKMLAYVERRKGQNSLRLGEIESMNSVELISFSERFYRYIAFAPDGKSIYFTARDPNHREPALMRVSVFGGPVQVMIPDVGSSFSFSPDGRSLAFLRRENDDGRTSLIIADAGSGKDERVLGMRQTLGNTTGGGISWSPDGQLIALAAADNGGTALFAVSTVDGSVRKIGETIANRIVNIAWLADGSGLIVNRNTAYYPNDGQIWFVSYPQGEARPLTDGTLSYSFYSLGTSVDDKLAIVHTRSDPKIETAFGTDLSKPSHLLSGTRTRGEGINGVASAPDGKILYTAIANDSRTIWEMGADGKNQRQLTTSQKGANDAQVSVTPDNRYFVFDSNRSGSSEIWRANRDGSDLTALTTGGGNMQPTLSPDGSSIVYVALRDGKYGLRRITIDGGTPVQITSEKSFWPAVSPDGRFIAFAYGQSDASSPRVIRIIPFEGGDVIKTLSVPYGAALYNRLRWSPDGKAIIYKHDTQCLWRQDLDKEAPEPVPCPDDLRINHMAYSADGKLVYSGGIQMREILILENFR